MCHETISCWGGIHWTRMENLHFQTCIHSCIYILKFQTQDFFSSNIYNNYTLLHPGYTSLKHQALQVLEVAGRGKVVLKQKFFKRLKDRKSVVILYLLMHEGTSVTFHSPLFRHVATVWLKPLCMYPHPFIVHSYTITLPQGRGPPTISVQFIVACPLLGMRKGAVQFIAKLNIFSLSFQLSLNLSEYM